MTVRELGEELCNRLAAEVVAKRYSLSVAADILQEIAKAIHLAEPEAIDTCSCTRCTSKKVNR